MPHRLRFRLARDRLHHRYPVGWDDQLSLVHHERGHGRSSLSDVPSDLARRRVHRCHALRRLQQHPVRLSGRFKDHRRRPVGLLRAVQFPAIHTGAGIEPGGERFAVVFYHRHHHAIDHYQRRRHAQRVARVGVIPAQPAEPQQPAVEIEGHAVVGREDRVNRLTVRGRCRGGSTDLLVGHGPTGGPELAFPKQCPIGHPEAQHMKSILPGAAADRDKDLVSEDERG